MGQSRQTLLPNEKTGSWSRFPRKQAAAGLRGKRAAAGTAGNL